MRDSDFAFAVALYVVGATVTVYAAYPRHDVRTRDADVVRTSADRARDNPSKQEFPNYFGVSLTPAEASPPAPNSRSTP
jgi:hypothetical protein